MKKAAWWQGLDFNKIKTRWSRWFVPTATIGLAVILTVVSLSTKRSSYQSGSMATEPTVTQVITSKNVLLPQPDFRSNNSIEAVLKSRRTQREFEDKSLSLKQVSQMLWAAQGVTVDWGGRTAPSAKSVYPLTIYLIANKVDGLNPGQYQYIPGDRNPIHELKPIKEVELTSSVFKLLNQSSFKDVPAIFIVTGNMEKMAEAFGGVHHDDEVYLEAGHIGQNLYLQAESLKLGMVVITTFESTALKNLFTIPAEETIIYLVPFGYPKQ